MKERKWVRLLVVSVAILAAAGGACRAKKAPEESLSANDLVGPSPLGSSQIVLHKTFSVNKIAVFLFEIPAHASTPHLHGRYKSSAKGSSESDGSANVDFLILDEAQHGEFVHGQTGEALFAADASHDQDVDVRLPVSQDEPLKFYLIFRNTPRGSAAKVVQAEFRVDF